MEGRLMDCIILQLNFGSISGFRHYAQAIFKPPKAMRGGIPICFSQFGNSGSLEQHGFARNKIWTIDDDPPPLHPAEYIGKSAIDLLLKPSEEDLKCWPHCFEFRLRVALALNGDLTMISRIRNLDNKPFSFSFAFHTYFSISVIRNFNGSCCWNLCCSGCHYTISSFVYTLVRQEERN
ncbi:putative glucose-6-phosphate 1-epimerase isoform X1 [Magnolia sinica]|uniref:putative glucose-6-phosphate 1-epimerase isoform X1 n=1 Tax=Magnolia sinica TaxID=86752 RepID=UPI002657BFBE|nr:putative glucose-6-phosphate 1-epimerase isoform X1 [Magnolia sinica]